MKAKILCIAYLENGHCTFGGYASVISPLKARDNFPNALRMVYIVVDHLQHEPSLCNSQCSQVLEDMEAVFRTVVHL